MRTKRHHVSLIMTDLTSLCCLLYTFVCTVLEHHRTANTNGKKTSILPSFLAVFPVLFIVFDVRRPVFVFVNIVRIYLQFFFNRSNTSSETQRQLVGTTGFSWAKVYNKSGGASGHLLLPIQFRKHLNSLLLIFFWPISEEEQPGDSHVFLHEVVFLINRRSSVARSTGTFLRTASNKKINK